MLNEEVAKYRKLSGDNNPDTPISRIGGYLDGYERALAERKTGEWIPAFDGKFTGGAYWFNCSKCNRIVPDVRNGGWDFCPSCGSRNM